MIQFMRASNFDAFDAFNTRDERGVARVSWIFFAGARHEKNREKSCVSSFWTFFIRMNLIMERAISSDEKRRQRRFFHVIFVK